MKFSQEELYSEGYHFYEKGDYAKALPFFKYLTVTEPFEERYWRGLGATLQMNKNYEDALLAWSMSAILKESDPLPHVFAAECLLLLENKEEASKALKTAKRKNCDEALLKHIEDIELCLIR